MFGNNQDSFILGVPTGTLSAEARQRQNNIQDFLTKSDYQLNQDFKKMQQEFEFAKALDALRQSGDLSAINLQGGFALDQTNLNIHNQSLMNAIRYGSVPSGAVQSAAKYLGVPYIWGAKTPGKGFDCSGLVQQAYEDMGYSFKNRLTSTELRNNPKKYGFVEIPLSEAKAGDVLWTKGHVALKAGANITIEAPKKNDKVRYRTQGDRFKKAYRHI